MDKTIQDLITTNLALVVMAIDDYQNKLITDQEVCMLLDGEKPALVKEDVYHVFLKIKSGLFNLSVGGWLFQQQDILIDSDDEKETGKGIMKIRLLPNYQYLSGKNATVLQGHAEPMCELHFVFINQKESYRLYRDYEQGSKSISVYHQTETFLDGMLFCLQKSDGQIDEFWVEEESGTEGVYELRYPLTESYERGKSILRRVYTVIADREGLFYLPVPEEEEGCEEYRYYNPLYKQDINTGTFSRGQVNEMADVINKTKTEAVGVSITEEEQKEWACVSVEALY